MKEENIVFESACGNFYVYKVASGSYEVNKNGSTYATRVGTVSYLDDSKAKEKAIEMCLRKEAEFKK